jgi:glyoxylase-like metal-dependent hydrolase (beta-lactamase superfamily II)
VPNVGIVVGTNATLVIDTVWVRETVKQCFAKSKRSARILKSSSSVTHFHSEHILGESAFPASAKVIRARAQQQDIEQFGVQPNFATRSPAMAELMKDSQFRRADEIFDSEKTLDLGGVRARLVWFGGTHTNGDTLIFIEGDGVLFAGDVIMNRRFLGFNSQQQCSRLDQQPG